MTPYKNSITQLIDLLPECNCDVDKLCRGAEYFCCDETALAQAAKNLPLNHDIQYEGVRRLLSLCLEEFQDIFSESRMKRCEVTVPAPACAVYALQSASKDRIRFTSSAFFAQIVLRGMFLHREPLDLRSCSKRRCGLNQMRSLLANAPPVSQPEYYLQFGVLCDECTKVGESIPENIKVISIHFPKGNDASQFIRRMSESFAAKISEEFELEIEKKDIACAMALYSRLMKACNKLLELNSRVDRKPLCGNSLALAQSIQLMSTGRAERFINALEILVNELEEAPEEDASKRFYCYYVPFLQPEIDRRFRENGAYLVGNAAFLESGKKIGFDLPGMIQSWLENMSLRKSTEEQASIIKAAMERNSCSVFITGAFAFDRWLGSTTPMLAKLLNTYGIRSRSIEADFWCENIMFGSVLNRIDQMCMK